MLAKSLPSSAQLFTLTRRCRVFRKPCSAGCGAPRPSTEASDAETFGLLKALERRRLQAVWSRVRHTWCAGAQWARGSPVLEPRSVQGLCKVFKVLAEVQTLRKSSETSRLACLPISAATAPRYSKRTPPRDPSPAPKGQGLSQSASCARPMPQTSPMLSARHEVLSFPARAFPGVALPRCAWHHMHFRNLFSFTA